MSFVRPKDLARTLLCAIFAALVMVLLAPGGAAAGCIHLGDTTPTPGATGRFDELDRAGALAEAGDRQGPERPSPCAGGACSRDESTPPAPTPPGTGPVTDRDVALAYAAAFATPAPAPFSLDEGAVRPVHAGGSVFRPPPSSP